MVTLMKRVNRFDFATAVVETRVLERHMIENGAFEKMLSDKNVDAIKQALREAGYRGIDVETLNRDNFDVLLRASMEHFAKQIYAISPDKDCLDLFGLEYDIFNIKCLLMSKTPNVAFEGSLIHIPHERSHRYEALSQGDEVRSNDFFEGLYANMQALQKQEGTKAVQEALDRVYYQRLIEVATVSRIELFEKYAKAKVDFYNLLCIMRVQRIAMRHSIQVGAEEYSRLYDKLLIDGGAMPVSQVRELHGQSIDKWMLFCDGTPYRQHLVEGMQSYRYDNVLAFMEKRMDDYLTQLVREKQFTALGPEALLGYLHGRKIEILNFRLVLTSIFLGVPPHIVRERLRECYV